jgi:hypothetical protein
MEMMAMQSMTILLAVHLLAAALWLGAGAMLTLYVFPAIRASAAAGGTVVAAMVRRGLPQFMAASAGITILSGLLLYWTWSSGRGAGGLLNAGGIMLTLGAVAGIVAAILGGAVLSRGSKELADLAGATLDGAMQARVAAVHARMAGASRIALTLLVLALLLMVFGAAV